MCQIRKYVSTIGNMWVWTNDGNMLVNYRRKNILWNLACPRKCDSVPSNVEKYIAVLKYHSLQRGCLLV